MSDSLGRWLSDELEPDDGEEDVIAAMERPGMGDEARELWRAIDTMTGQNMNPPLTLAQVRRRYLEANRARGGGRPRGHTA